MIVNVLTLPRTEELGDKYAIRHSLIIKELKEQNADAHFWFGEQAQWRVENGISRGHKSIIRHYKYQLPGQPCLVVEDDVKFLGAGALKFFLDHIPDDYDLYLGCISSGNIEEDGTTKSFSGMLCYICHPRFMDTFLYLNENADIDRQMTINEAGKVIPKGKFVVCNPMICTVHTVYSLHYNEVNDYTKRFEGRNLYNP